MLTRDPEVCPSMIVRRDGPRWGLIIVLAAILCARVGGQTDSPTPSPSAFFWYTPSSNAVPTAAPESPTSSPLSSLTLAPTTPPNRTPAPSPRIEVDTTLTPTYSLILTPGPTGPPIPSPSPAPIEADATNAPVLAPEPAPTKAPTASPFLIPTPAPTFSPTPAVTSVATPSPTLSLHEVTSAPSFISNETPRPSQATQLTPGPTPVETQELTPSSPPTRTPLSEGRTSMPTLTLILVPTPPRVPTQTARPTLSPMLPSPTSAPTRTDMFDSATAESTPTPIPSANATVTSSPTSSASLFPSSAPTQDYEDCDGLVQFIGNGYCTIKNNNANCSFDGGDCCPCTCTDSFDHICSESGFQCLDPDADCDASAVIGDEDNASADGGEESRTNEASSSPRRAAPLIFGSFVLGACTSLALVLFAVASLAQPVYVGQA